MHKDTFATLKLATLKLAGLVLVIFLAYLLRSALIEPPAVDPGHAFNTERAHARLARILGDEAPHPVDSAANDAVIARLVTEIETLGFQPILRDEHHCVTRQSAMICARLQNIAFWVTEPAPNAVLLLSHHDSVPAGPGASDDGAGVASSLEIASLMKSRDLTRPLLVLITDGEEPGLMGANMFVTKDPLAKMVGAVVNMEARGISGLAASFQTSRPNSRDLKTLTGTTRLPAASSLNADVYELLPNDTDLSEFLPLPIDAVNLAYTGDVAFYHTPGDTLANMDKRALFHLGASGLASAEAFLAQSGTEPESQLIYVDILGMGVLAMPVWLGAMFIILAGLFAILLLWRERKTTQIWRVLIIPPLALLLGIGLAVGANWLVGLIRIEALFGAAYPMALRGLHASAGLTGAVFIYTFLTRTDDPKALLGATWLWTSLIGLAAFAFIPGAMIFFASSLAIFAAASVLFLLGQNGAAYGLSAAGTLLFAVIALPLSALGERGLFIEASAPFAITAILIFSYAAPLIWPKGSALLRSFWMTLMGAATLTLGFLAASLLVPAYSENAPRALSISHVQSNQFDGAYWSVASSQAVPAQMRAIMPFEAGTLPILGGDRQLASAVNIPSTLQASISANEIIGDVRKLKVNINAPQSDRLVLSFSASKLASGVTFNGQTLAEKDTVSRVVCSGRTCQIAALTLEFPADAENIVLHAVSSRFGLGDTGESLVNARPNSAIPKQLGDVRIEHIRLTANPASAP